MPSLAALAKVARISGHCLDRFRERVDRDADIQTVRATLATGHSTSRPAWLVSRAGDQTVMYVDAGGCVFPVERDGEGWVVPTTLVGGLDHLLGRPGHQVMRRVRVTDNVIDRWHLLCGRRSASTRSLNRSARELRELTDRSVVYLTTADEVAVGLRAGVSLALSLRDGRIVGEKLLVGAAATVA